MRIGRAVALSCATAALAVPAAARAGTYEVAVCHDPASGATVAPDAISFQTVGADADAGVAGGCGPGGYVYAALDGLVAHAPSDLAAWRFTAPPGTTITGAQLWRSFYAGATQPFAAPVDTFNAVAADGSVDTLAACAQTYGCTSIGALSLAPSSELSFGGLDAAAIQGNAACGGGQTCAAGGAAACPELGSDPCTAANDLYAMVVTLSDSAAPLVGAVGGSLTQQGPLTGATQVTFDATDAGSGLYSVSATVDGRLAAQAPFGSDGGRCAAIDPGPPLRFASAAPCAPSGSTSLSLDTSTLADGSHQVAVTVQDAAGNSSPVWSGTVLTHNAPQGGTPTISGTPRVGETLSASPGTWAPTPSAIALQWWRCDAAGGACAAIAGARSATYTATAADQYGQLEVSVVASDASGSSSATSAGSGVVADANGYLAPPAGPALVGGSLPTLRGADRQGARLTATPGDWSNGPLAYAYQWQRCDAAGLGCRAIDAARAASYVLAAADDYGRVRVLVTASGPGGASVAASMPTLLVADPRGRTQVPGGRRVANGRGACAGARLSAALGAGAAVPFGRPVALRGTLRCGRAPIAGALVELLLAPAGGSGAPASASVRTAPDGSFAYTVAPGPSREITVRYRAYRGGAAVATARLTLAVRPSISLAIAPTSTTNGQTITFAGAVSGGFEPAGGLTLDVEVLEGSRWTVFDTVPAFAPGGSFDYRYTFRRTTQPITYTFRVAIPAGGVADYPFLAAASAPRSVHVDP